MNRQAQNREKKADRGMNKMMTLLRKVKGFIVYRGLVIIVTESSEQKVGSTLVWGEGEIRVPFFG